MKLVNCNNCHKSKTNTELELSLYDVVWFWADSVVIIILEQKLPVNAEITLNTITSKMLEREELKPKQY